MRNDLNSQDTTHGGGDINKKLLDAINSIHMGNFHQIFKNIEEQKQAQREQMKTQIKIEGDRVAIKKEQRQKQSKHMKTLSLKNSIQYKRVL